MKCHYEVLDVQRDADDAVIKTAYRKMALRWHPDKNLDNSDAAKTKFQAIQQAYEVLSDAQERAWYDRHREQILRGSNEYSDESLDVFHYFTATCYRGFDDGAGGFYAVYKDVFEKLAAEDIDFMDNDDEIAAIPGFGKATSDYEQVVGPFYAFWSSYCTKKSYAWLCPHNVTEIRDRRLLRHIEKDTKKLAQKAKRERNDEVRALVAFVRKRDKRVLKQRKLLEEKAELNRAKHQEKRLQQIRANMAEAEEMRKQQKQGVGIGIDHEAQLRQLENTYRSGSEDEDYEDDALLAEQSDNGIDMNGKAATATNVVEEVYIDHLYCVACNKSFKSESSMRNHEPSKKHRDNIERLRLEMQEEEDAYDDEVDEDDLTSANGDESDGEDAANADMIPSLAKTNNTDGNVSDSSVKFHSPVLSKKGKVIQIVHDDSDCSELDDELIVTQLENEIAKNPSTHKQKKSKKKSKKCFDDGDTIDGLPPVNGHPSSKNISSVKKNNGMNGQSNASDDNESADEKDAWSDDGGNRKTKKAMRKAKRAVPPMAAVIADDLDINHTCVTCKASFDSKNKLFTHLKKVGHGVFIEGKGVQAARATAPVAAASKPKGRKK